MEKLTALEFKKLIESGVANLSNHAGEVDALNVFPVPDGDTGTNMSMTAESGLKALDSVESESVSDLAKAFSKGLLLGARGNSGVITSQIFRGFYQTIEDKDTITALEIADGFENGARVAYKAIMKPVEGTILTVIREAAWYAKHDFETNPNISIDEYFINLLKYAEESLAKTPDLLPVLKEVGVVDSGGAGLVKIFEGFKEYVEGTPVIFKRDLTVDAKPVQALFENEEFGYCTEFILKLSDKYKNNFDENILKNSLNKIGGESLVVVKDDDLVKVHVHMLKPGEALNVGQRYGEFLKLKIENMSEQHSSLVENEKVSKEHKQYGVIAVASGKGLCEIFNKCNVDIIIFGGQTMNPSTQDFVDKIKELDNCDHILIFPNNSNIILAANQAKDVLSDKRITVVETKSIPAGVACLSSFIPDLSLEDNLDEFKRIIANLQDASLTYAIKDTNYEGVEVKEGDFIAMTKKSIVAASKDKQAVLKGLLDELFKNEDAEILTVYVGEDGCDEDIDFIEDYVENNSELEIEVFKGDQPVYSYLFGLE